MERITVAGSELYIARARIHDVGSFIVGVTVPDIQDLSDEIWTTIRDYSKSHIDFGISDRQDLSEESRQIESLEASQHIFYQRYPGILHRPFSQDDPTDNRVVHPESLRLPLTVPAPQSMVELLQPLGLHSSESF